MSRRELLYIYMKVVYGGMRGVDLHGSHQQGSTVTVDIRDTRIRKLTIASAVACVNLNRP